MKNASKATAMKSTKSTSKPTSKVVVKAKIMKGTKVEKLAPAGKAESLNVKQASEKIFKLISSAPGKLTKRSIAEKSNLHRGVVKSAVNALWAANRITRKHKGTSYVGGFIVGKRNVRG